ncbi:hypothetical protein EDEG_03477 [Edhazardia aedis USNM 41457]|uniref:Uncharacterized protein n=1 Tax=Edhazardia aedis (strain USNM 41457) TaxID=1003232 RepID=J9DHK3_EDHAE|nr:hypothetical protein EDEG_03477 [Edhazardia aedis USNM 41457]|eukprot:EJW02075.1 hypothetical protein EDEG_03477 [Edhazardia aedis USNM 41457]
MIFRYKLAKPYKKYYKNGFMTHYTIIKYQKNYFLPMKSFFFKKNNTDEQPHKKSNFGNRNLSKAKKITFIHSSKFMNLLYARHIKFSISLNYKFNVTIMIRASFKSD